MRPRDPRRLLERHRRARARVKIMDVPRSDYARTAASAAKQEAEVTLPRAELDRIWSPEYLERLARTYWRFLTRISLGLLRVLYTDDSREVVVLTPAVRAAALPQARVRDEADCGTVTWRIERGLLVAPSGRGDGYLRLTVERRPRTTAAGRGHRARSRPRS